jgi:hypothetical protein
VGCRPGLEVGDKRYIADSERSENRRPFSTVSPGLIKQHEVVSMLN